MRDGCRRGPDRSGQRGCRAGPRRDGSGYGSSRTAPGAGRPRAPGGTRAGPPPRRTRRRPRRPARGRDAATPPDAPWTRRLDPRLPAAQRVRDLDGEPAGRAEEAVVEGLRQDHADKELAKRGREGEEREEPEA